LLPAGETGRRKYGDNSERFPSVFDSLYSQKFSSVLFSTHWSGGYQWYQEYVPKKEISVWERNRYLGTAMDKGMLCVNLVLYFPHNLEHRYSIPGDNLKWNSDDVEF
jgi:hypothetical protein